MMLFLGGTGPAYNANMLYEYGYNRLFSFASHINAVDIAIDRRKLMELFLAGIGSERDRLVKEVFNCNGLYSYEYDKKMWNKLRIGGKIFIDSGAFSAWTQGIIIDTDQYIKWLNQRSDFIYLCGQVDAIPNSISEVKKAAEKTWKNYLYMRQKLNNPDSLLYTFHVGEPINFLDRALSYTDDTGKYIPYIALGGMVGKSVQTRRNFLTMVFNTIKKSPNPDVKVHTFGMTDKRLLEEFPITSTDSTAWVIVAAMGGVMTDMGVTIVTENRLGDLNHYNRFPDNILNKFRAEVEEFGFTLGELSVSRDKRAIHNARYMWDRISKIVYKPQIKRKVLF